MRKLDNDNLRGDFMKLAVKYSTLASLSLLFSLPNMAGGAPCNAPNGFSYTVIFSVSTTSGFETKYGFEQIGNDKHVSVGVGNADCTYVNVKVDDQDPDPDPDWIDGNKSAKFYFVPEHPELVEAIKPKSLPNIPVAGFVLKIRGLSVKNPASISQTRIIVKYQDGVNENEACGEIIVHVYNKKSISNWHVYLEQGVDNAKYANLQSEMSTIVKPAVMEFSAPTLHENYSFDDDEDGNSDYDVNENGAFDYYVDGSPQTERDAMLAYLKSAELDGPPTTIILKGAYHSFKILSISSDRMKIQVNDPNSRLTAGRLDLLIGDQSGNHLDDVNSMGEDLKELILHNPVESGLSVGDVVRVPGEVNIKETYNDENGESKLTEGAICSATDDTDIILHETLHCNICGYLRDLNSTDENVGDNVMKASNMGYGVLRCKSLPLAYETDQEEIQWDRVH